MKLPSPPSLFQKADQTGLASVLASLLTLQEMVQRYDDQLPPVFETLLGREAEEN